MTSFSGCCKITSLSAKGSALPPEAHAKGTRKTSPSAARPALLRAALLGIQLSPRFDMRPAVGPRYLPSLLFLFSAFQLFSFCLTPPLELAKRQPQRKPLVLGEIHDFLPDIQPRFSATGRSTCFFEIRSLHSVKICTLTPFQCRLPAEVSPRYHSVPGFEADAFAYALASAARIKFPDFVDPPDAIYF